jgi:hypothetical protein
MKIKCLKTVILGLLVTGCATRELVMQANVISMTKTNIPKSGKLVEKGDVEASFCAGDTPALPQNQGGDVGMVDEAIYKAQGQGKKADFITGAMVYRRGTCIDVSGRLAKAE